MLLSLSIMSHPCPEAYHEVFSSPLPGATTLYSGGGAGDGTVRTVHSSVTSAGEGEERRDVRISAVLATEGGTVEVGAVLRRRRRRREGRRIGDCWDAEGGDAGGGDGREEEGKEDGTRTRRVDYDAYVGALPPCRSEEAAAAGVPACVAYSWTSLGAGAAVAEAFVLRGVGPPQPSGGSGPGGGEGGGGGGQPSATGGPGPAPGAPSEAPEAGGGAPDRPDASLVFLRSVDPHDDAADAGAPAADDAATEAPAPTAAAYLIVRGPESALRPPGPSVASALPADPASSDPVVDCEIALPFLPLALRLVPLVRADGTLLSVGAFVGSSEDSRLRLFAPMERRRGVVGDRDGAGGLHLEEIPMALPVRRYADWEGGVSSHEEEDEEGSEKNDRDAIAFTGPVMAIDCLTAAVSESDGGKARHLNHLAVGCQDGIIRAVSFECRLGCDEEHGVRIAGTERYEFEVAGRATNVVVDGPIVSVALQTRRLSLYSAHRDQNSPSLGMDLLVGSLCGFACALHREGGQGQPLEGPIEIVSDLWSGSLGAEDGVLCVRTIPCHGAQAGYAVAIGTLSGRVLLFEPIFSESGGQPHRYELLWSCHLHYAIHGISFADVDGDGLIELLVTTRRSIHIFRPNARNIIEAVKQRMLGF